MRPALIWAGAFGGLAFLSAIAWVANGEELDAMAIGAVLFWTCVGGAIGYVRGRKKK
jgi:hypothetical protein